MAKKSWSEVKGARMGSRAEPSIARWEAGGVAPSIETLERIAAALDLDLVVDFANPPSGSARGAGGKPRRKSA